MINVREDGFIATVTLSNPEKRNALSPELLRALNEVFSNLNSNDQIKTIVIEAQGKAFCAGADLKYLQQIRSKEIIENLDDSMLMMKTFRTIYESPKIVIAKVQGDAIAGGCGLITLCDFVVAVDTARFGFTEVAIGFVPAIVGIFVQRKIGEAKSRPILLRAHLFNAHEAKDIGLVYDVVSADSLDKAVQDLANELSKHPQSSVRLTKNLLAHINDMDVISGLDYATSLNALSRQTEAFRNGIDTIISRISGDKK